MSIKHNLYKKREKNLTYFQRWHRKENPSKKVKKDDILRNFVADSTLVLQGSFFAKISSNSAKFAEYASKFAHFCTKICFSWKP